MKKNNKIDISIIVPVYNNEKYLKRCLDSILNQTYKNFEVILVDDGSIDSSSKICDEYSNKYSNIKVIHKKNGGLGNARNKGLEFAKGKYIKFIDSDDYIRSDHLKNLHDAIEKYESDAVLSGYTRVTNGNEIIKSNIFSRKIFEGDKILNEIVPCFIGTNPGQNDYIEMSVCMALFKREIIQKNKIKFKSERNFISEDLVFDLEYYPKCNKVCFSNDVGYCYCDNENSLTTKYREDRFEKQVYLSKYVEDITKKLKIYDCSKQRIFNTLISIARYSIKLEVKYVNQNTFTKVINNIKKICNNDYLINAFKNYNNDYVPLKNKCVNFLIRKKMVYLLYIVMYFKNLFKI